MIKKTNFNILSPLEIITLCYRNELLQATILTFMCINSIQNSFSFSFHAIVIVSQSNFATASRV